MRAHHDTPRFRSDGGFTLPELLIVMTILGLISGALGVTFITSMRASQKVATLVPGAQATQNLQTWLKSDIESASPTGAATWIDSSAGAGTGCLSVSPAEPPGAQNMLHIETKDPTGRATAPNNMYAASYRYRTDGTLWRTWCIKGGASVTHSELITGLKAKPTATYDAANNKISVTAITRNKAVDYSFSLVGAVRTASTTTVPANLTTTTKPSHDPCAYTAATVRGYKPGPILVSPITKNSTGNSPGFLGIGTAPYTPYTLGFTVTATGNCSNPLQLDPITGLPDPEGLAVRITIDTNPALVIETIPLTMDLAIPGSWRNVAPYYTSPSGQWQRRTYSTAETPARLEILDGYNPADPANSPGYPITGPTLLLKVDPS